VRHTSPKLKDQELHLQRDLALAFLRRIFVEEGTLQEMSSVSVMLSIEIVLTIPATPALNGCTVSSAIASQHQGSNLHDTATHDQAESDLDRNLHLLPWPDNHGWGVQSEE